MELFSVLSFIFLLILLYHYFYSSGNNTGFKNYPIVGTIPEIMKNSHRFLDWEAEVLANCPTNTAVLHLPGKTRVITANPLNVDYILRTNFENYSKGEEYLFLLEDFLGRGIFNSDGKLWKVQRKLASYEFNSKSLKNFFMEKVVMEIKTRLLPLLEKAAEKGLVLDMQNVVEKFSFDNICELAFSFDPGCLGADGSSHPGVEFMKAFQDAGELIASRYRYFNPSIWKLKRFFNIGSERRLRESISTVDKFIYDIIRPRIDQANEEDNKEKADLLSRYIESNIENGSPEFLRDVMINTIEAGQGSTGSALSWFFWVLSSRKDTQEKILNELKTIRARNKTDIGETFSYEELRDMQYLHAAFLESMRLYSPLPVNTRKCENDDVMPDGTFVKKGWFVSYDNYAMARLERIWGKNCAEYYPERWLDEDGVCRQESPCRYVVFHAGPRICPGKEMAYIQMKAVAASIIERFEISKLQDMVKRSGGHLLSLSFRIQGGVPVTVRKR